MQDLFSVEGRVVLVTGASRGIGWQIAKAFAAAGALVAVNGRDAATIDGRVAELRSAGGAAEAAVFDVADRPALASAIAAIVDRHGRLDVVVANVGQRLRRPTVEVTADDFAGLLDVNLVAAFDLARHAAIVMGAAGRGSIVLMSSIAAGVGSPRNAAYSASKAGLEALCRCLAVEFGPQGVRTNAIAPGTFATEFNANLVARASPDGIPLRRFGDPAECAGAALFLAADASSYVNGHVLVVDGGLSITA